MPACITLENASYCHADTFSNDPFVLLARLLANFLLFTLGKRIIILPILLRHPVRMGLRTSIVTRGNATKITPLTSNLALEPITF